ncbi:hypothetical protein ACHAXA_000038 [Cyclostephanos tholiformis]|uniref:Calcineurin-like phosphoesterase domain-containing protein n=1 Tax=Cyclostephanos tholiformis TaxID=382380 RepID=A0ABD3SQU0_9STRA
MFSFNYSLLQLMILVPIASSFQPSCIFRHCRSSFISTRHGLSSPLNGCTTSFTALWSSSPPRQIQVGDEVMVVDEDGVEHIAAVIEQKRGGWYTLRSERDSSWMKRRGSQLERKEVSRPINGGSFPDTRGIESAGNAEPSEGSARIVNLDSILQSMQQENSTRVIHDGGQFSATTNQTISLENLHQLMSCHSQYDRWVIFSDLHVMPSTLSTCLQVLDTVHRTAVQFDAGIIFLGDFWHHRGFVRVDCLNAVLQAMVTWEVPSIMIPGNHDQIDFRGLEHALTPLSNAYRIYPPSKVDESIPRKQYAGPFIISHPTKFLNALFCPHIRDKEIMKSILSSNETASSSALFVHADVKGASMNDMIPSRHGLSASIFPAKKSVYSGHFHKPHVIHVGKKSSSYTSIRYVGSPYQTSFSESGQVKSLLLLDSKRDWQCIKEIPIDIGPRFFRVSSLHRFLDYNIADLRKGDKVAVTINQQELEAMRIFAENGHAATGNKSPFNFKLEEFRQAGISVELRDLQSQQKGDGAFQAGISSSEGVEKPDLECLSPKTTFSTYLENEVNRSELGATTARRLLEYGEVLLGEANDVDTNKDGTSQSVNPPTDLDIESVSVLGFGSFREEIVFPLRNRGVLLLKGKNKDDIGSDSNGVGKSTLAMASLWALTGSLDPRPTQDGKVADVVNDSSRVAEVTLRGSINTDQFIVKRTKSMTGRDSSLTFVLNGKVLTQQSIQGTQELIDKHFSTRSLMRTIFQGQHSIGGLLESTDSKLKEELSSLVSLDIWQKAASLARLKQRELLRKVAELEGMLLIRGKDKLREQEKTLLAKEEMVRRDEILKNELQFLLQKEQSLPGDLVPSDIETAMVSVQTQLNECESEIDHLEEEASMSKNSSNDEIDTLRSKLNEKLKIHNNATSNLHACQRKHEIALMELHSAESRLSHLQSKWNVSTSVNGDSSSFSSPKRCHTCGQPIVSTVVQEHVRDNIFAALSTAKREKDKAAENVSFVAPALAAAKVEVDSVNLEIQSYMKQLRTVEEKRSLRSDGLLQKIKDARKMQSKLSNEFAILARKAKEVSEFDLLISRMQTQLNGSKEALKASVAAHERCCNDLAAIESNIEELRRQREASADLANLNSLLADAFGPKGVQAFVLRNIVQSLQYCSQTFLNELSDGSLQLRMQVGSNDSIIKQATVRNPDGSWRVRPLSSLSGGQWRRCSLSLSLGFIDLASKRGRMRSSLLVLDEPLTHLDSAGRKSVGKLLRKMLGRDCENGKPGIGSIGLSTILVILQEIAAEEIEDCFDQTDEVIKLGGESFVILDENHAE